MGQHYVAGNSTPIQIMSCQRTVGRILHELDLWTTHGIPAYITGPFQDGNPSLATDQMRSTIGASAAQNTGTATNTTGGNIGIFINGVRCSITAMG